MIKKYFAMTIIAASVAMSACSSDDDEPAEGDTTGTGDDTGGGDTGGGDNGGGDNGGGTTPTFPPATPGTGNTAVDVLANDADGMFTDLIDLVVAADLADMLDDPDSVYTIFAPANGSFGDADAVAALKEDIPALQRILKNHVLVGAVQSGAVAAGVSAAESTDPFEPFSVETAAAGEPAQSLTFTANAEGTGDFVIGTGTDPATEVPLLLSNVDKGVPTEVDATVEGVVHVIEGVLLPAAAEVVDPGTGGGTDGGGTDGGGTDGGGTDGGIATLLEGEAGGFTKFIAAITPFEAKFLDDDEPSNNDPWAVLAISDATLGDAEYVLFENLIQAIAATPTASEASPIDLGPDSLASIGTINTFQNAATLEFTQDGDTLMLGNRTVRLISDGVSKVYVLDAE